MTTTTAPDAQAWLAKETTSPDPFVVRLDGDRVGFGALAPGHWVVVVDALGALRRVGRILRIRADLTSTTLYFDKLHTVKVAGSLADIRLTFPTGLVTRLRPRRPARGSLARRRIVAGRCSAHPRGRLRAGAARACDSR